MKRINIIFAFVAAILLTTGCARTDDNIDSSSTGAYTSQIILKTAQTLSRASADSEIKRLDILIFKDSKLEKYMPNITSFSQTSDGLDFVEVGMTELGVRSMYIIANNDNRTFASDFVIGNTTIDQVLELQTSVLTKMANPPLVMYGVLPEVEFTAVTSRVECPLSRVVSCIDVVNKDKDFVLTSARLIKARNSSKIFPTETPLKSQLADFEQIQAANNSVSLYTYENIAADKNDATAVEITGTIENVELKYTVDLVRDGQFLPLERNFRYTINVNAVNNNVITAVITVRPWIIGDGMNEQINANLPTYELTAPSTTGLFTPADSTLTAGFMGGGFAIDTKANAECAIELSSDWLELVPITSRATIDDHFEFNIKENTDESIRTAKIVVYNRLKKEAARTIIVKQDGGPKGDKYMVVVVAGQSNSAGYDRSGFNSVYDNPDSRAFQLSYRRGPAPNQHLSVIPLTYNADNIDPGAIKGIHLPLAKELLKYVPDGYKILIVPVAYTGTVFGNQKNSPIGTYNTTNLAPNEMAIELLWSKTSPYARTIIDRTKYVMDKFPASKLAGIVWCQGEGDRNNSDVHYPAFTSFADEVLNTLSEYGPRTAVGAVDKRLWFTYTPCIYWVDWYNGSNDSDATGVFGGYKVWNPNNFIHIPVAQSHSNPTDKSHYGLDAFSKLVAPMVAQRMNQNGVLFNGVTGATDHFADKTTLAMAQARGGDLTDPDLAPTLKLFLPFRRDIKEKIYGSAIMTVNNLKLVDAQGLKDINGNPRSSKALQLTSTGVMKFLGGPAVNSWTVSFLAKRYGNNTGDKQVIITNSNQSTAPFIGFKKYYSTAGVAGDAEFMVEPLITNVKNEALPGLFMHADNVRDLNEWIHYVVTFDNDSKLGSVYMNGKLVQQATIRTSISTALSGLVIGSSVAGIPSAEVELMDLGVWSKALSSASAYKLFLMSYYDFTK